MAILASETFPGVHLRAAAQTTAQFVLPAGCSTIACQLDPASIATWQAAGAGSISWLVQYQDAQSVWQTLCGQPSLPFGQMDKGGTTCSYRFGSFDANQQPALGGLTCRVEYSATANITLGIDVQFLDTPFGQ